MHDMRHFVPKCVQRLTEAVVEVGLPAHNDFVVFRPVVSPKGFARRNRKVGRSELVFEVHGVETPELLKQDGFKLIRRRDFVASRLLVGLEDLCVEV